MKVSQEIKVIRYSLATFQGRNDMPTENKIRIATKLIYGCKFYPFQFILNTTFEYDFLWSILLHL